ncbi:hypothetical protein LQF61_01220 [Tetragenococcus koreensis]|uniref:hypothetical protein n=1 Tax=Tetragenococcus koreensis TaxID=290335 RepID=UPI000F4F8DFF|nr:hypothetical protein [Tetragenococcus koreensis]AYW45489.1 hypothetical protein C7K43_05775 [Tetragenococcus koreensis]MCF1584101.1 hypothetical protein [Tetragenococcus koreensis]MCF1613562.1 hypothetical protein [Tetragenococcus koreensis]MCF1617552.1 hypothetical protein [Tetragenococcus koreensis]MCF1618701.1 hypothetical protein [Tetragenococcus koreensis]
MKYFKSEKEAWLYAGASGLLSFLLILMYVFSDLSFTVFMLVTIVAIALLYFRPICYQIKMIKEKKRHR